MANNRQRRPNWEPQASYVLATAIPQHFGSTARRELISGRYIHADETPVDVQTREGQGKNHQGYVWQYSSPPQQGSKRGVRFPLGSRRDAPKGFLGQFEGILQTDGYAAHDQIGGPRMVHATCWVYARRQFSGYFGNHSISILFCAI